jgi:hypothetical protein
MYGEFTRRRGFTSSQVSWVCLVVFLFFIFDCFVRGSPHHFVSVWPCGFIYKAERKPVSRVDFEPSWAEMSI